MITMQSWMFLSSYEKLRTVLRAHQRITSMLHLGTRAFDSIGGEVVASTAFVLENASAQPKQPGVFVRLIDGGSEAEKAAMLTTALDSRSSDDGFHFASGDDFAMIPGAPIVYWLSEKMRAAFFQRNNLGDLYDVMNGMTTGENAKFLRFWSEVSESRTCRTAHSARESVESGARWFPYNKGGEFRKWYGNQDHVINWENDGHDVIENGRAFARGRKLYFRSMVSWAKISSGQPAFRFYPAGFLFDVAGTSMFGNSPVSLFEAVSLCNSSTSEAMLAALSPTLNFESGQIARLPVVQVKDPHVQERVTRLVSNSKSDWDLSETSADFTFNPLILTFRQTSQELLCTSPIRN